MKCAKQLIATLIVLGITASVACAAEILVVEEENTWAFFGWHGSSAFADQPEKLFDDTVAWAAQGKTPDV